MDKDDIINIREISLVHAKDEMVRLLSDGKTRHFDEIAEVLKLDIQIVVKAFKELSDEGRLFVDENSI